MAYKRRSQLDTLLAANITDNTAGENTAANVREVHADTFDSVTILEDAVAKSPAVTRVRVVDTVGLDPSADYENGDTIDGVVVATGDLVLRAESAGGSPSTSLLNGVYIVAASGAAARHEDFGAYNDHPGALFVAREGTLASKPLICTSARGGTLGTTDIEIVQAFGDAAYKDTGTGAGTVAAGDDSRITSAVPNSRTVTAGAGLTDGGALSGDITLNVGAGTGILANANDVAVDKATDANFRAAASNKVLTADGIESVSAEVTLTDAATIALDWDSFINGVVTLGANRVLGNPTNGQPGTWRTVRVLGNSTTDRTLTFGNQYLNVLPEMIDIDSAQEYLLMIYCVTTTRFCVFADKATNF